MRIHTDTLTYRDICEAARIAHVEHDTSQHGSRSRQRAFNILLTGESKRRPNAGTSRWDRKEGQYAATWDQWGVFLAVLFERDPNMVTLYYADAEDYANKTADRFGAPETVMTADGYRDVFKASGWPTDAHGDHTFRFVGVPRSQSCTKCSATKRW